MIRWKTGTVVGIVEVRGTVQVVDVADESGTTSRAIRYTDTMRPLRPGDRVRMNATAAELSLGSGGAHFVYDAFGDTDEGGESLPDHGGHIMKLRYTPLQRAVLAAEEPASPHHGVMARARTIERMPVLIGELHSMLPIALAWMFGEPSASERPRVSYVMTDGGALPLALSRHAAELKSLGWLDGTITCGHAYGGELETVNRYTALLAAKHVQRADVTIAVMGPGIVGTGTPFGHTGTETADLIHAVAALGGVPIVMPRISFADARERHRGISHHLLETLGTLTLARAIVPLPEWPDERQRLQLERQLEASGVAKRHELVSVPGVTPEEAEKRMRSYPVPITTMGRGLRDDPAFFAAVCAAAQHALSLLRERR
ncbi:DUF3866 family protein [Paenibacillus flagellatus]|uniref:DUF3866 domain-containing protein n=1 Tax=Paenibacillus flagellatus TaxID=2211139 RepID=A0A2V5K6W5_9BACL|nr:DUF3866 family protein [Paenibacillus flagellatus]PYI55028.1 DUF3866 domain-containing protein [Paenibacillus flagellatus]